MTINELLALAGLTASDEIPVWDAEGQVNGRTKKITAQNLAASIKTIASLIASSDLDTTPTSGSTKAVQSGGVYDAIQQSTATAVAKTGVLVLNATTWSELLAALRAGLNQHNRAIALFVCYNTRATSILTGGRVTLYMKGYVTLSGGDANLYDFFGGALSNGDMYAWRITASDSSPTISNFRRFVDYEQSTASLLSGLFGNLAHETINITSTVTLDQILDSTIQNVSAEKTYGIEVRATMAESPGANRNLILMWSNPTRKYAFALIINFNGLWYAKRGNTDTFAVTRVV